jgi:hypothetical protein
MMTKAVESLLTVSLAVAPAFGQSQASKTQDGGCPAFSLRMITEWLDKAKADPKGLSPDFILVGRISKCGILFDLTGESRTEIQKHGGSAKLLGAIEHATRYGAPAKPVTPPPEPPPPPAKQQGTLTVACAPVDCQVLVEGISIGPTVAGKLSQARDVGPITVSVLNPDYDPDKPREMVAINPGVSTQVEFKLKPSAAALERAGTKMFRQMIEALGGEAGLKAFTLVRGTGGTLNSYRDSKPTTYDLKALIRVPDKARFSIRRGAQSYEVAQSAGGLEWLKPPKGSDNEDLDLPLRLLQEYQISKVIGHLQDKSFHVVADRLAPAPGEDTVLRAIAGSERSVITLDPESRPREIRLESAGLSSGQKIVYSNYVQKAAFFYPMSLQVILPGASGTGFELRFADVELNPADVKDTDFNLKPGKRGK